MSTLTKTQKDALFDKIVWSNPSNRFVYKQLLQTMLTNSNQIVPFIGAGVSIFAFNTWGGLLKELLAQIDQSDDNAFNETRSNIEELIRAGDYFQAADYLETIIGSDIFYFSLVSAFTEEVFVHKGIPDIPENAVARWLPKVFPNARIITTNYDSVLEWAYAQQNYYLRVCTPSDDRMFMQFMPRRLYKIHGSYDSNYEDIVLTSRSYDEKYESSGALYNNFKILVRNSVLLFIGASLRVDKTLDLLSDLANELTKNNYYSGNMHYAILHIDDDESRNHRKQELAKYKIMPILYSDYDHSDVSDKHAIVSIILEHLFFDWHKQQHSENNLVFDDSDIHDDNDNKNEKDARLSKEDLIKRQLPRILRDDPLNAIRLALSLNDLSLAESMLSDVEKALPPEIFISRALTMLSSRGSTLAALRLFSAINGVEYDNLSTALKIQTIGSLISYCNRQDKEIEYLDMLEKKLCELIDDANTEDRASIYNQLSKLYYGAYTNNNKDEYIKKCREYIMKAIEDNPSEPSYFYNLAIILNRIGDLEGSTKAISTCIEKGSEDPDHFALAYKVYKKTNDDRAGDIYRKLVEMSPIQAQILEGDIE